ncbi:MAG: hypothetical protein M5R36_05205 [Deltaproteobacteria bacterium]|nr:hypothetical protein [Deltaproteobacteria bacterium]
MLGAVRWFPTMEVLSAKAHRFALGLTPADPRDFAERVRALVDALAPGGWPLALAPIVLAAVAGAWREEGRRLLGPLALAFLVYALLPEAPPTRDKVAGTWGAIRPFAEPLSAAPIFLAAALAGLSALGLGFAMKKSAGAGPAVAGGIAALIILPTVGQGWSSTVPVPEEVSLQPHDADGPPFFYVVTPPHDSPRRTLSMHPALYVRRGLGVTNALQAYRGDRHARPLARVRARGRFVRSNRGYKGEAYFPKHSGKVLDLREEANAYHLQARTFNDGATLFLNRNFHKGWRSANVNATRARGQLVLRFPKADTYDVIVRFVPDRVIFGAGISFLALAGLAAAGVVPAPVRGALTSTGERRGEIFEKRRERFEGVEQKIRHVQAGEDVGVQAETFEKVEHGRFRDEAGNAEGAFEREKIGGNEIVGLIVGFGEDRFDARQ